MLHRWCNASQKAAVTVALPLATMCGEGDEKIGWPRSAIGWMPTF